MKDLNIKLDARCINDERVRLKAHRNDEYKSGDSMSAV